MATVEEILRGLPRTDADLARDGRILLAHLLGRANPLALRADTPVPEETARRFAALGAELRRGAPLQYLIGEWDFFGRTFFTDARALIPRPETEHLVEEALRECPSAGRIADLGCGSGILAVTLALECPGARVTGVDRSPAALALARQNARRHGVLGRVALVASDWLAAIAGGDFDLVVSNPPYVALADRAALPPRVREFEPEEALFAGTDGLSEIRRLLDAVPGHLRPGGVFGFELGFGQEEAIRQDILRRPAWTPPRFARDLAGISRVAVLRRSSASLEYP